MEHQCSQEGTLATICTKLENIEKDVCEIKTSQKVFIESLTSHEIRTAQYPTPEATAEVIKTVSRHETWFQIIWIALGGAWAILLIVLAAVAPMIIQRLFGE